MQKQYNKLVRDKIPEIIRSRGAVSKTRTMEDGEYLKELDKKLTEETMEYLSSHAVEELADIYEVLLAILHGRGISFTEFEKIRNKKAQNNGTFEKKVFLVSVEE